MRPSDPRSGPIFRDRSQPDALANFYADCARTQAETRATGKSPRDRAIEDFARAARKRLRGATRNAARRYQREPWKLDAIERGLSHLEPRELVLRCEAAVERADLPTRLQIVPVTRPNARGALLIARWLRRFGERDVALVAAE